MRDGTRVVRFLGCLGLSAGGHVSVVGLCPKLPVGKLGRPGGHRARQPDTMLIGRKLGSEPLSNGSTQPVRMPKPSVVEYSGKGATARLGLPAHRAGDNHHATWSKLKGGHGSRRESTEGVEGGY